MRLSRSVLLLAAIGFALPLSTGCAKHHVVVAMAPPPPPPPAPPPPAPEPPKKISLPGELQFDVAKATIKDTPESASLLTQLADIMKQNPRITKLRIEGHTDNTGKASRNLALSQARADAVADWLASHEIDRSRLSPVGYGHAYPVVDNDSNEHRTMNRRTEFHIQELDGKPTEDAPHETPGSNAVAGNP
jgi:OOP family OmpA-OmpF porin